MLSVLGGNIKWRTTLCIHQIQSPFYLLGILWGEICVCFFCQWNTHRVIHCVDSLRLKHPPLFAPALSIFLFKRSLTICWVYLLLILLKLLTSKLLKLRIEASCESLAPKGELLFLEPSVASKRNSTSSFSRSEFQIFFKSALLLFV